MSWFYYSNEILVVNQWRDIDNITCELDELMRGRNMSPSDPLTKYFDCDTTSAIDVYRLLPIPECTSKGEFVIAKLKFKEEHIERNFGICGAMLVIVRVMAYIALFLRTRMLR